MQTDWSEADQAFIAEVPELSGCMAHGDAPESALANAQQAIALWLDTAREFGDPISAPKGAFTRLCALPQRWKPGLRIKFGAWKK